MGVTPTNETGGVFQNNIQCSLRGVLSAHNIILLQCQAKAAVTKVCTTNKFVRIIIS